ncbi:hypothetical protein C1N63_02230 [Pantoea ananatis]|nr:hypothetical protein C1N63_02230 [Pantoea ananatis]
MHERKSASLIWPRGRGVAQQQAAHDAISASTAKTPSLPPRRSMRPDWQPVLAQKEACSGTTA